MDDLHSIQLRPDIIQSLASLHRSLAPTDTGADRGRLFSAKRGVECLDSFSCAVAAAAAAKARPFKKTMRVLIQLLAYNSSR